MTEDQHEIVDDFVRLVNMTATELERWLGTEESHNAGHRGGEPVAFHHLGSHQHGTRFQRPDAMVGSKRGGKGP